MLSCVSVNLATLGSIIQCLSFCNSLFSTVSSVFSMLWHVLRFTSFLSLNSIPLYVDTTFCLSIHPLVGTWVAFTFGFYGKCYYKRSFSSVHYIITSGITGSYGDFYAQVFEELLILFPQWPHHFIFSLTLQRFNILIV
jgi:hypothetical protein